MTRLLILLAIAILAFFIIRRAFFPKTPSQGNSSPPGKTADMVRCELCGLHIPRAEAVIRNNRNYCCEDHANRSNR